MEKPDQFVTTRLLKARDIKPILGVSLMQVYRLMKSEIPCIRFGSSVRVRAEDLERYIQEHRISHGKETSQ